MDFLSVVVTCVVRLLPLWHTIGLSRLDSPALQRCATPLASQSLLVHCKKPMAYHFYEIVAEPVRPTPGAHTSA